MTNAECHRRRDAQRLMNWNRATAAEHTHQIPPDRQIQAGRIIGIDDAVDLTPQFINEFARVMENNFNLDFAGMMAGDAVRIGVDPAGEPEGRQVSGLEIRNRPTRRGLYFGPQNQNSAPPMNQRSRVTAPVYFNRWMDMADSEDELQSFLWLCYRVAERDRTEGAMTVKEMEGDADG